MSRRQNITSQTESIPVLYIAGDGRSGSTVLERILCQHTQITAIGEARSLWTRGYRSDIRCNCGEPMPECPFWSSVLGKTLGNTQELEANYLATIQKQVTKRNWFEYLFDLMGRRSVDDTHRKKFDRTMVDLYRNILEESGSEVILDSSKEIGRVFFYDRHPDFELFLLHLVRDPRGVVYSWESRTRPLPEYIDSQPTLPQLSLVQASWNWLYRNLALEFIKYFVPHYRRIFYENFVTSCSQECNAVFRWLRLETVSVDPDISEPKNWHSVSGNPNRFQSSQFALEFDDEWTRELDRGKQKIIALLTSPLFYWYGY